MTATTRYGGWFNEQPISTGSSFNAIKVARLFAATMLAVGTGGTIDFHWWQQHQSDSITPTTWKVPTIEVAPARSPAEDLERVREIFSPAISDLGRALGVSRQAVYNWVNGEQPKPEHLAKLRELAQAADAVVEAGIPVTGALLKRKVVDGKNLFEIGQSGGSVRDAVQLLIQLVRHETEQRERMTARFADRKGATRSVESDFPAANDVS
jgi:transcriptional regulator with XRE-family HTH domain